MPPKRPSPALTLRVGERGLIGKEEEWQDDITGNSGLFGQ